MAYIAGVHPSTVGSVLATTTKVQPLMLVLQIELHDVGTPGRPSVRSVPILAEGGGPPTPLELQDALPLKAFLAPIAACKDNLIAAIEALEAQEPGRHAA